MIRKGLIKFEGCEMIMMIVLKILNVIGILFCDGDIVFFKLSIK